ncbi:MAG TPA: hypothetical protein DC006_02135 [Prevotellaceae bacterium]|nr:hypothetical protein [Prevotellaceae bacterium]HBE55042.1 hypothetical protein [Prevotellaceae bacterium]
MRLKYFLAVTTTGLSLFGIGWLLGPNWFVFALFFYGFVIKPLIDCYFIRKRNLTHGKPLPWYFPFIQQYTWDLLFKKDDEEDTTASETK